MKVSAIENPQPQQANCILASGFVELSEGATFYRFDGPESGKLIVLVHGATVGHWEFDLLVPLLSRAGYRILRYDLFGHGRSARPQGAYDIKRFVRQCQELIDALAIPDGVLWFAHSLGSAISAYVLSERPHLARQIILSAPMLNFSKDNPFRWFMRTPLLSPLFVRGLVMPYLHRRRQKNYHAIGQPYLAGLFAQEFSQPDTWKAMLGIERDGALGNQRQAYHVLAEQSQKVAILWGDADTVIPRQDIELICSLLPLARYQELPKLKHNMILEGAERVAEQILEEINSETGELSVKND